MGVVSALAFGRIDLLPLGGALALLVLWRHKDNIHRLLNGSEPRIGASKTAPPAED